MTPIETKFASDRVEAIIFFTKTNVPPEMHEHREGHAARATVNRTYPRHRPHYPAVRGPAWAAWLVEWVPVGSQPGIKSRTYAVLNGKVFFASGRAEDPILVHKKIHVVNFFVNKKQAYHAAGGEDSLSGCRCLI
jgi:hypothetical protein